MYIDIHIHTHIHQPVCVPSDDQRSTQLTRLYRPQVAEQHNVLDHAHPCIAELIIRVFMKMCGNKKICCKILPIYFTVAPDQHAQTDKELQGNRMCLTALITKNKLLCGCY